MKKNVFLTLSFLGAMILASPQALLADNIQNQCQQASELRAQGDLQGAQAELDAILKKNPQQEDDKVIIGFTLAALSEQFDKAGDRTRAVADLREALRLDPSSCQSHGRGFV